MLILNTASFLYTTFADFSDCQISFACSNNCFLNSAIIRIILIFTAILIVLPELFLSIVAQGSILVLIFFVYSGLGQHPCPYIIQTFKFKSFAITALFLSFILEPVLCALSMVMYLSLLSYVSYLPSCPSCLVPYVLLCLTCLVIYVLLCLTCLLPHVPCALIALLPHLLSCLTCPSCLCPLCTNITFSTLVFPCFTWLFLIYFTLVSFFGNLLQLK